MRGRYHRGHSVWLDLPLEDEMSRNVEESQPLSLLMKYNSRRYNHAAGEWE
eukprot:COSAG01_NODE_20612_length_945_cov_1.074468_2_plen_50_part_01